MEGATSEAFLETEVAEVLASTWKEKRAELSRLQKTRKFTAAKDVKRSFRIEVEELKKRTKCHRCGRLGHWSRECRAPRNDSKSSGATASASAPAGAALVESSQIEFVAYVSSSMTLLQRARALRQERQVPEDGHSEQCGLSQSVGVPEVVQSMPDEVLLVSSPGFGVLDSGCGKTIVGSETLRSFEKLWADRGLAAPCKHVRKRSSGDFKLHCGDASGDCWQTWRSQRCRGLRQGSVVDFSSGDASPSCFIDFEKNEMQLFPEKVRVPLQTNAAGQFVLSVMENEKPSPSEFQEVMITEPDFSTPCSTSTEIVNDPAPSPADDDDGQDKGVSSGSTEKLIEPLNVWIIGKIGIAPAHDFVHPRVPSGPVFIVESFVVIPLRKCCLMKP